MYEYPTPLKVIKKCPYGPGLNTSQWDLLYEITDSNG